MKIDESQTKYRCLSKNPAGIGEQHLVQAVDSDPETTEENLKH